MPPIDFDRPREDLVRMVTVNSETLYRAADDDGDGLGTLVGYPVVFNEWTEINGWEGNFLERIDPGALTKTLAERADSVKVLFNHGFDPLIGDKPLGKPRMMEPQDSGLWTETPLDDVSYNKDLVASLRSGALDGMSFRFTVQRDEWEDEPEPSDHNPRGLPERTIKDLRLYEFGPVTFPAYEATTAGVRARDAYLAYRQAQHQPEEVEEVEEVETDPTLTVLEDLEPAAPEETPPVEEPDDTPDSVHLSDPAPSLSLARMKRQAASMSEYWELVMRNRT